MSAEWVITKSYIEGNYDGTEKIATAVDVRGPNGGSEATWLGLLSGEGRAFRLIDGDGIIYFTGRCVRESFAPLDDYGMQDGCIQIQFYDKGWKTL